MIKVNEMEILAMLEEGNYEGIAKLVKSKMLENQTKPSDLSKMKAFSKLAKATRKEYKESKPALAGAYTLGNKLCLCDGFRAFIMNWDVNQVPNLEMIEEDRVSEKFDINKVYQEKDRTEVIKIDTEKLKIQYTEYKAKLKLVKSEKGMTKEQKVRSIQERYFAVESKAGFVSHFNIEYIKELHDIMDLDNSEITLGKEWTQALQVENSFGKALVLPIRLLKREDD